MVVSFSVARVLFGKRRRAIFQRKLFSSVRVMVLFHLNFCSTFCKRIPWFLSARGGGGCGCRLALCLDFLPCVSRGQRKVRIYLFVPSLLIE